MNTSSTPAAEPTSERWLTPGVRGLGTASLLADRAGNLRVLASGSALFGLAFLGLALTGASLVILGACFVAAGVGIGCAETAEHAAVAQLAPEALRGSAFGLLAAIQSAGNLAASAIAGALWTLVSPAAAFSHAAAWMLIATVTLGLIGARR